MIKYHENLQDESKQEIQEREKAFKEAFKS